MTISTAGGEEYMYLNILKYIVGIMFTLVSVGFALTLTITVVKGLV